MLGMTQAELAERLAVTRQSVMCWETNRSAPNPQVFRAVLELLVETNARDKKTEAKQAERTEHLKDLAAWGAKRMGLDGKPDGDTGGQAKE